MVINEIYPKTADSSQQWIELYNTSAEPISIDRWKLTTSSNGNSFTFNASAIIAAKSFLTIHQPQSNITFSITGDTVQLFDENSSLRDSQTYQGVLGYNTAMGRTLDGDGVWALCTLPTSNQPNSCPVPTATPMPPTSNPTPPPPTPTEIPGIVSPTETAGIITPLPTRLVTVIPTLPPVILPTINPIQAFVNQNTPLLALISIGVAWLIVIAVILVKKSR